MLVHVDLARGLAECHRALRPGGAMLVYVTLATDLMEPKEARRLYEPLAIVPENMDPAAVESAARTAGFEVELQDPVDSEWRERWIEEGDTRALADLLTLARLRRARPALIKRYGADRVDTHAAGRLWGTYQLLGKLRPTVYVFRRGTKMG